MSKENTTVSFRQSLDRWQQKQATEYQQLTTDKERITHTRKGNQLLKSVLADLKDLTDKVAAKYN